MTWTRSFSRPSDEYDTQAAVLCVARRFSLSQLAHSLLSPFAPQLIISIYFQTRCIRTCDPGGWAVGEHVCLAMFHFTRIANADHACRELRLTL
jgi:hypothetical protein